MPAAGSLRSSADDMIRFLAACLQPPAGSLGAALSLAQTPHARMGKGLQLGLCWMILKRPDRPQVLWHNGGTWSSAPSLAWRPNTASPRWSCRTPRAVSTAWDSASWSEGRKR